jgi:lysozyme
MKINQAGLDLIKKFESLVLHPYKDGVGIWTIGWGHVIHKGEYFGTISFQEAEGLLEKDLQTSEQAVSQLVKVPLNENQFSALVSFTFNLGAQSLSHSTLLKLINTDRFLEATAQFSLWIHAGGKVEQGLVLRRRAEMQLFIAAPPPPPTPGDTSDTLPLNS